MILLKHFPNTIQTLLAESKFNYTYVPMHTLIAGKEVCATDTACKYVFIQRVHLTSSFGTNKTTKTGQTKRKQQES
jgi:hypothetical protein